MITKLCTVDRVCDVCLTGTAQDATPLQGDHNRVLTFAGVGSPPVHSLGRRAVRGHKEAPER